MHCALIAVLAAQAVLAQRFPNSTRHALQPAVMGDFRLQGCEVSQTETPGFQELASSDEMSVDYCAKRCKSEYFGVSDRKCYCGHSLAKSARAVDEAICNTPCPGNAGQICGGTMRVGRRIKNARRQEQAQEEGEQEGEEEGEQQEPEQQEPEQQEPEQQEPEQQEAQQEEAQQEAGQETAQETEQEAGQDTQQETEQEGETQPTIDIEVLPRAEAEVDAQPRVAAQEAIFSLYKRFRSSPRASNATAHPMASLHALNATAHNNASANASLAGLAGAEGEACIHGYTNNTRGERVCHDGKGRGQHKPKGDNSHGRPYNLAVVNGAAVAGASSLLSSIALAVALLW